MTIDKTLIDDILAGASIRVVLHPRQDVQINFPDMYESFDLRHVILIGERFFAKTANSHAVSSRFSDYSMTAAFSYAYSNFYSFVVNGGHVEKKVRVYNKNVYHSIRFVPTTDYETIWDSATDRDVKKVEDAIASGRRLKIALLDGNGIWNVHPVHMPSFYIDKNFFELFTDQDAAPDFLYDKGSLDELERLIKERFKEKIREQSPRNLSQIFASSGFEFPRQAFRSTFYTVRSDGQYLHGKTVLSQEAPLAYQALKVFAEARRP